MSLAESKLIHGSVFSGIGGFDLGFQRVGIETLWQVEKEKYAQKVLAKNFPKASRFTLIEDCCGIQSRHECTRPHHLPWVHIVSGGFPCQDISHAGKGAGLDGNRSGLWREQYRILCELRPDFAVVENVAALFVRGFERVLGDLAALGYDAEWETLRAEDVGAPHRRERIWIVSYPSGREQRRGFFEKWRQDKRDSEFAGDGAQRDVANSDSYSVRNESGRSESERSGATVTRNDGAERFVADAHGESGATRSELHEVRPPSQTTRPCERGEGNIPDAESVQPRRVAHSGPDTSGHSSEGTLSRGPEVLADADRRGLTVQRESSGESGLAPCGGETVADADSSGREERRGTESARETRDSAEHDGEDVPDSERDGLDAGGLHSRRRRPGQEEAESVGSGENVSDSDGIGREGSGVVRGRESVASVSGEGETVPDADDSGRQGRSGYHSEQSRWSWGRESRYAHWWAIEPDVGRVAHGIPSRVDRLKGLGNAIVPQIAEQIGEWILESIE